MSGEARTLAELEAEVMVCSTAFKPTGSLLAEIRDRKLWAPDFASFAHYMAARWGPGSARKSLKVTAVFHDGELLWDSGLELRT